MFDTVPHTRRQDLAWFYLLRTDNVVKAYHAVSLDESRGSFQLLLWNSRHPHETPDGWEEEQTFFPGNHGDVGGGWEPYAPSDGVLQKAKTFVGMSKQSPPPKVDILVTYVDAAAGVSVPGTINKGQALQELCCQWMLTKAEGAGLPIRARVRTGSGSTTRPWRLSDDSLVRLARQGIVHDAWNRVSGGAFSAREVDTEVRRALIQLRFIGPHLA